MRIITNLDNKTWKNQETLKDIQQQMQSQHAQNTEKYHNLRQDVLNDQRRSINFWMTVFVVTFSTVFSAVSTLVYFETKELQQKAEISLGNIKKYEKDAEDIIQGLEGLVNNPEQKLTKETKQKVKELGTKSQKLILKIRQENYKTAIDLWKYFIGHAYYENDKKNILTGYSYLGYSYDKLEKYQKAIDAYKKAIEIKPDLHYAYFNMGPAYFKLEKYQKAIDTFKKVIEIKPDFHKAYSGMGMTYRKLKKYQKAIDAYKKAIEIKPDYHEAYYSMGVTYGILKEYQKAIDAFKKAIEIKPDYHKAKRSLNLALKQFKEQ